jgi:hypothetical protein
LEEEAQRLVGFFFRFFAVRCCGGLFATTSTARSKRSQASDLNSDLGFFAMPRQPFAPFYIPNPLGSIAVGTTVLGTRPKLETIVAKCLMAWPIAESEMALFLGQLLGIGNEPAVAVFQTLRRATAQRDAIEAAAKVALNTVDFELVTAMLNVHKSAEAERTALSHGHFGTSDMLPDGLLWMTTRDYVEIKVKMAGDVVLHAALRQELISRMFVYKENDLQLIYGEIADCANMWSQGVNYLRSRAPRRAELYHRLSNQLRIAPVLARIRQKNTPSAQPQSPPPTDGGTT